MTVQIQLRPTLAYKIKSNEEKPNWQRGRAGVSAAAAAIIVVVIMLLGFAIYLYAVPPKQQVTPPPTTTSVSSGAYSLAGATTGYDHFNPGTTYTAATNFNVLWDVLGTPLKPIKPTRRRTLLRQIIHDVLGLSILLTRRLLTCKKFEEILTSLAVAFEVGLLILFFHELLENI